MARDDMAARIARAVPWLLAGLFVAIPEAAASRIVVPQHKQGQLLIIDDRRLVPNVTIPGLPHVRAAASDGRATVVAAIKDSSGKPALAVVDTQRLKVVRTIGLPGTVGHSAVSAGSRYAAVTYPDLRSISVIDIAKGRLVKTVELDAAPSDLVFDVKSRFLFVSDSDAGKLIVVPLAKSGKIETIEGLGTTGHLVMAPDNAAVFAADERAGTIKKIALASRSVVAAYKVGQEIHGIDISPDGSTVYAADFGAGQVVSFAVDSGMKRALTLDPAPYHLTALSDTRQLVVTSGESDLMWSIEAPRMKLIASYQLEGDTDQFPEVDVAP